MLNLTTSDVISHFVLSALAGCTICLKDFTTSSSVKAKRPVAKRF